MKTRPIPLNIVLRPLTGSDSAAIYALAAGSPGAAQWSETGYESLGANRLEGWGAFRDGVLHGFIIVRRVEEEMEILNLAVDPTSRRSGIASRLLVECMAGGNAGVPRRIFLEVRESNSTAQAFYSSQGFVLGGRRRGYYSDPLEDALVLVRTGQ
jgi:ribosomal-protein-alanine N-acetyltransferase